MPLSLVHTRPGRTGSGQAQQPFGLNVDPLLASQPDPDTLRAISMPPGPGEDRVTLPKDLYLSYRPIILRDFVEQKPPLSEWTEWTRAEAYRLQCPVRWVLLTIRQYSDIVETGIEKEGYRVAKKVAETMGVGLSEIIKVCRDAMLATRHDPVEVHDNGRKATILNEVPDHSTRLRGAHQLAQILAAYAPSKVDVAHTVSDQYAEMTDAQLQAELLRYANQALALSGANPEALAKLLAPAKALVGANVLDTRPTR